MAISASQQIDSNFRTVTSNEAFILESSWTFVAGTTGAQTTHTVFDVTGKVALNVFAICTSDLTGSGTVALGVAGSTASLGDQQTGTDVNNHMVWHDSVLAIGGQAGSHSHIVDQDVILTIGTNTITGGNLTFYCLWRPLSSDGNVTTTTPA